MQSVSVANHRESFHVFHSKGDDKNAVRIESTWLYIDGAMMGHSTYGELIEPPTDKWECAKLRLRFQEELLSRATDAFVYEKQQCLYGGGSGIEHLKKLQAEVLKRRKACEKVRKEVDDATPAAVKQREQEKIEQQIRMEKYLSDVKEIKI